MPMTSGCKIRDPVDINLWRERAFEGRGTLWKKGAMRGKEGPCGVREERDLSEGRYLIITRTGYETKDVSWDKLVLFSRC